MKEIKANRIVVSRVDSIGDVVLTLPLCVSIKVKYPNCQLVYLCKNYTRSVVACFEPVDEILTFEELKGLQVEERSLRLHCDVLIHVFPNKEISSWAKAAKIPIRIGTSHRWFHWFTCNIRPSFTRKNSNLHEAQLNYLLLRYFELDHIPSLEQINEAGLKFSSSMGFEHSFKNAVIIHPLSQGSALDYPLSKYVQLAQTLVNLGETVCITGTELERQKINGAFEGIEGVKDLTGKMSLAELISFISSSKALVACSTGPLHLAGVLGVRAIGLYSSRRPIHPGRWRPIGKKVTALVFDEHCEACKSGKMCNCLERISVDAIVSHIQS